MAFTAPNGRTQIALADINITPLVDVVLVLLIIFMVTAPVLQSGIEVAVPKTRTVKEITEERLVISINKKQEVFLGSDPVNINEIGAKLRKKIRDPQHQSRASHFGPGRHFTRPFCRGEFSGRNTGTRRSHVFDRAGNRQSTGRLARPLPGRSSVPDQARRPAERKPGNEQVSREIHAGQARL